MLTEPDLTFLPAKKAKAETKLLTRPFKLRDPDGRHQPRTVCAWVRLRGDLSTQPSQAKWSFASRRAGSPWTSQWAILCIGETSFGTQVLRPGLGWCRPSSNQHLPTSQACSPSYRRDRAILWCSRGGPRRIMNRSAVAPCLAQSTAGDFK